MTVEARPRQAISALLREHAGFCRSLGSELYLELLARSAEDVEAGGPAWEVLRGRESDVPGSALPLRFMAAVHRLVLRGHAPDLAERYPSAGGGGPPAEAWPPFLRTLERSVGELRRLVQRPCQTNEVGRSAALVIGFLEVARSTGLPLRLLEVGASAGLNLRWDHYRYEGAGAAWGDPDSPVRFTGVYEGPPPPLGGEARVIERSGSDPNPLDPSNDEDRLSLESAVWADHVERLRTLRAAFGVTARVPVELDRSPAADWIEGRLGETVPRTATVVFHSVVLQYLRGEERSRFVEAVAEAGARAAAHAPVAWLRMEPMDWHRDELHRVVLTVWPGGEERLLARSGAHGRPVLWVGGDADVD